MIVLERWPDGGREGYHMLGVDESGLRRCQVVVRHDVEVAGVETGAYSVAILGGLKVR